MTAALSSFDRLTVLPMWRSIAIFILVPVAWGVLVILAGQAASAGARPLAGRVRRSPRPRSRRGPVNDRAGTFSESSTATASLLTASGRGGVPLPGPSATDRDAPASPMFRPQATPRAAHDRGESHNGGRSLRP